jgi:hypothetical protein
VNLYGQLLPGKLSRGRDSAVLQSLIALIELHKVRNGAYPKTLEELQFMGYCDAIAIASVKYRKLESRYELDVIDVRVSQSELKCRAEFW